MRFTLGRPIFTLLLAAAATGLLIWRRPAAPRPNLVIWSFAQTHVATLGYSPRGSDGTQSPSLLEQFQARTGLTAAISVMGQAGENIRLASAFMSGSSGPSVPDLCEIEINSIGQFLRSPVDDVGLLPLNDFLQKSGWDRRIIASRFAPWSKIDPRTGRRIIYGIPEDVHPVTITYRKDLFDEAGVDLRQAGTWSQFQALGLAFQAYWANHGQPGRRAIALSNNSSDELVEMLLQRHINLIDSTNQLHFTDPKLLETLVFYAQLIAGARAIGAEPSPGVEWTQDFDRGDVCAICSPDWKAEDLHQFTPDLAGKIAMMPLPRFDPGDAPTSTLGGTMIGICRTCPDPERAWQLLEFLYLSPQSHQAAIAAGDDVLPAIPEYWSDPAYHTPDGDLYVQLAPQIPERVVTPYTYQAELALAVVLHRAKEYLGAHDSGDGLKEKCAGWLAEAQEDIRRRIDFGNTEP
jgi:ABC-type glycerol-3-phosphate transport system substrate-binding protein